MYTIYVIVSDKPQLMVLLNDYQKGHREYDFVNEFDYIEDN